MEFQFDVCVTPNSGVQYFFYPWFPSETEFLTEDSIPQLIATPGFASTYGEKFAERVAAFEGKGDFKQNIERQVRWNLCEWDTYDAVHYVRTKWGVREIGGKKLVGWEIAVETNQAKGDAALNRGYLYKRIPWTAEDPRQKDETYFDASTSGVKQPPSVYLPALSGEQLRLKCEVVADIVLRLVINVVRDAMAKPIDVDLVIDFGNTRTAALLVRKTEALNKSFTSFKQECGPVFLKCVPGKELTGEEQNDITNGIVSSWFVLHQPEFETDANVSNPDLIQRSFVPGTKQAKGFFAALKSFLGFRSAITPYIKEEILRIPNMFVQYSPVRLGDEAVRYLDDARVRKELLGKGLVIEQSSPKRYFRDDSEVKQVWSWIPNYMPETLHGNFPTLCGNVFRFINSKGHYVDPDETVDPSMKPIPKPTKPLYPRSTMFLLMFLGILERAWMQCNRDKTGVHAFKSYQLRNVVVTYPAGWSNAEVQKYRERCQAAVDIFVKSNFSTTNKSVKLRMEIDESVASQIPYLFSEIHGFADNARDWIHLHGKRRGGRDTVRIMNFDIGGGTSDISVVEYSDQGADGMVEIQPVRLLKSGFDRAGDEIIRRIIAEIILPVFCARSDNAEQLMDCFRDTFSGLMTSADEQVRRSLAVKRCLVPIAVKILESLCGNADTGSFLLEATGIEEDTWNEVFLPLFPEKADAPTFDSNVRWSRADVNKIVRSEFGPRFSHLAKTARDYDVDILFLSGKTSEIPEIEQMAREYLPLTRDRIICAKNYRAGEWYPFAEPKSNIVKDAKSVTVVGAAVYDLLSEGFVPGWKIHPAKIREGKNPPAEWGLSEWFARGKDGFTFSGGDEVTVKLQTNMRIARRINALSAPEDVYVFRRKDGAIKPDIYRVVLARVSDSNGEDLKLKSVKTANGEQVTKHFELGLSEGEVFWQDSGTIFE